MACVLYAILETDSAGLSGVKTVEKAIKNQFKTECIAETNVVFSNDANTSFISKPLLCTCPMASTSITGMNVIRC